MICGILFDAGHLTRPQDRDGCCLPFNHEGPHEFVASHGVTYQWETDVLCNCEHCTKCEGDYCAIYWPKRASQGITTNSGEEHHE